MACYTNKYGFALVEMLIICINLMILAMIILPVCVKAYEMRQQTNCMDNQRKIADALMLYAQEHQLRLPEGKAWSHAISLETKLLICPTPKTHTSYGLNQALSGVELSAIDTLPVATPFTIDMNETAHRRNVIADQADIAYTRHNGHAVGSYLDGHIEIRTKQRPFENIPTVIYDATAADYLSGNEPYRAVDNNLSTAYQNNSSGLANSWLQLDIGEKHTVTAIEIWNYANNNTRMNSRGMKRIQVYIDNHRGNNGSHTALALSATLEKSSTYAPARSFFPLTEKLTGRFVTIIAANTYGDKENAGVQEVKIYTR